MQRSIQNHLYRYIEPLAGYKFATARQGTELAVWLKEAT